MTNQRQILTRLRENFNVLFQDELYQTGPGRLFEVLAMEVDSQSPKEVFNWLGGFAKVERWLGERTLADFKAYDLEVVNELYEATIRVQRTDIEDDAPFLMYENEIAQLAEEYFRARRRQIADLMNDGENIEAFDGQGFFSDTHPVTGGGTQSNITAGAFDGPTMDAVIEKMELLTDEGGRPLEIQPDTIIMGPKNRANARVFFQELNVARNFDGSDVPGVNEYFGLISPDRVIIDRHIEGEDYYLYDSSISLKPVIVSNRVAPEIERHEEGSDHAFKNDEFLYGLRSRWGMSVGLWQPIHKVTVA